MRVIVREGDTLCSYSQVFNIPLILIQDSNPGINPALLQIGQEVKIPGYVLNDYHIQFGDTLWKIAVNINVSLDMLFMVNPGIDPNRLFIGQQIFLPQKVTHPVVRGKRDYTYEILMQELALLHSIYPFLFQRSIGQSVMGKDIPEVQLGKGPKKIHVNGSFHAQEWITTSILVSFLNHYALALTDSGAMQGVQILPLYQQTTLSMVPMVNPDGVNLVIKGAPSVEPYRTEVLTLNQGQTDFSTWKANIRGVDLNNQFPAQWDIEAERKPNHSEPRDYPGQAPLSEPESRAMAQLTAESHFDRVLAFHTQGQVIYWGFLGLEPVEAEQIVLELQRVSGYTPIQYVDSYAGYKDWFIQQWRRPGFTVELGLGVNPLPLIQFDEIYDRSSRILIASLYM